MGGIAPTLPTYDRTMADTEALDDAILPDLAHERVRRRRTHTTWRG